MLRASIGTVSQKICIFSWNPGQPVYKGMQRISLHHKVRASLRTISRRVISLLMCFILTLKKMYDLILLLQFQMSNFFNCTNLRLSTLQPLNYRFSPLKLNLACSSSLDSRYQSIEEETRIEQKRSYFFLNFSIWHLWTFEGSRVSYMLKNIHI